MKKIKTIIKIIETINQMETTDKSQDMSKKILIRLIKNIEIIIKIITKVKNHIFANIYLEILFK